jgi:hypothetical protein
MKTSNFPQNPEIVPESKSRQFMKRAGEFIVARHVARKSLIAAAIGGLLALGYAKRQFLMKSGRKLLAR